MKSKKTKIYSVILFLAMVIGICSPNGISRVNAEGDSYLITWVTTKGCMGHDFGEDDEEIPIMKTYTHVEKGDDISTNLPDIDDGDVEGEIFVGWQTSGDNNLYTLRSIDEVKGYTCASIFNYTPSADTTFTAVFVKAANVTFVSSKGDIYGSESEAVLKSPLNNNLWLTPTVYTNDNSVLAGWKLKGTDTIYSEDPWDETAPYIYEYEVKGDVVFEAVYEVACNVTFKTDKGEIFLYDKEYSLKSPKNKTIKGFSECNDFEDSDGTCYKFIGWKNKKDNKVYHTSGSGSDDYLLMSEFIVSEDTEFDAVWEAAYKITFDYNGGHSETYSSDDDILEEEEIFFKTR